MPYKKLIVFFVLFILQISLSWAVTKNPIKQMGMIQPDKALVYLIRPSNFIASVRTQFVYLDQAFLGALDNNTYTFAYVNPGTYLIWTNWTRVQKKIIFDAGQVYYFRIFDQVLLLAKEEGISAINSVPNFAGPTEKELKKAQVHIQKRYGRAKKRMEKDEYAQVVSTINSPALVKRAGAVFLPALTSIKIKLLENVTSALSSAGDKIAFQINEDVTQNGKLLIVKGTPFTGVVWHRKHGKTGGVAGTFELLVSSVPAADGNLVPVSGHISTIQGTDRTNEAMVRYLAAGLVGFLTTKSREGFLFSQQEFIVTTKEDTWILPMTPEKIAALSNSAQPSSKIYEAIVKHPIKFFPYKKKSPKDITVDVGNQYIWDQLSLVAIDDTILSSPVTSQKVNGQSNSQNFIFDGWNIVRYIPIGSSKDSYELKFSGISSGHSFPVVATISVKVKAK